MVLGYFLKNKLSPFLSNFMIYFISPLFLLVLSFIMWCMFPIDMNVFMFSFGFLFFLMSCLGLSVYGVLISGWSSNSNYAMLGTMRSVAQTVSYEALIILNIIIFAFSFNFLDFKLYQEYSWFVFLSFPMFYCWYTSCLVETNRSPFDFAEGESELVSGFNIEYSSGGFAFIFLSEYMNILFMSMLSCAFFWGCDLMSLLFYLSMMVLVFGFIWIRGTLPHYWHDKQMYLGGVFTCVFELFSILCSYSAYYPY